MLPDAAEGRCVYTTRPAGGREQESRCQNTNSSSSSSSSLPCLLSAGPDPPALGLGVHRQELVATSATGGCICAARISLQATATAGADGETAVGRTSCKTTSKCLTSHSPPADVTQPCRRLSGTASFFFFFPSATASDSL